MLKRNPESHGSPGNYKHRIEQKARKLIGGNHLSGGGIPNRGAKGLEPSPVDVLKGMAR